MRKRRVELEVKVKELEGRVKQLEKNEKDNIKALEKERKRVEKRQAEIVKLQVCVNAKERDAHFNSGCIGSDGGGSGFGFTCSS